MGTVTIVLVGPSILFPLICLVRQFQDGYELLDSF